MKVPSPSWFNAKPSILTATALDLFARDAKKPSLVQVTAKAYRRVALYEPGEYVATLTYYDGSKTVANWLVRDLATVRKAKNVILFIGGRLFP